MKALCHRIILRFRLAKMFLSAQKITSVILIACVAASYFAMQIVLGPSTAMTHEIQASPMTDSFCLDFSENGVTDNSLKLLSDLLNERTTVLDYYVSSGFYGAFSATMPTILGVKNCGNNSWYIQAEGRYFSEAETNNHSNVAIISRYDYEWNDFDLELHSVQIDGNDYMIVGLGDYPSAMQFFVGKQDIYHKISKVQEIQYQLEEAFTDHNKYWQIENLQSALRQVSQTILIPYTNYEKCGYIPSVVCIMFSGLSEKDKTNMHSALAELFPEATIVTPPNASHFMATTLKSSIITSLVLSCCCLAFLYALFAFWIDHNRLSIRSCRVVGASAKDIKAVIYASWLFILTHGYVISILLAYLCNGLLVTIKMSMSMQISHHVVIFSAPLLISPIITKLGTKEMR